MSTSLHIWNHVLFLCSRFKSCFLETTSQQVDQMVFSMTDYTRSIHGRRHDQSLPDIKQNTSIAVMTASDKVLQIFIFILNIPDSMFPEISSSKIIEFVKSFKC